MSNGSKALHNDRHEQYAISRASGLGQAESWKRTVEFGTVYSGGDLSLRVSGSRCEKREEVKDRISFLRRERASMDQSDQQFSIEPQAVLALMDDVSAALLQASKVAKKHGADRLSNMLCQSLVRHVNRHRRIEGRTGSAGTAVTYDREVSQLAQRILRLGDDR